MPDREHPWVAAVHDTIAPRWSIGNTATDAPRLSNVIERKL
jgi:hypothetical protein